MMVGVAKSWPKFRAMFMSFDDCRLDFVKQRVSGSNAAFLRQKNGNVKNRYFMVEGAICWHKKCDTVCLGTVSQHSSPYVGRFDPRSAVGMLTVGAARLLMVQSTAADSIDLTSAPFFHISIHDGGHVCTSLVVCVGSR